MPEWKPITDLEVAAETLFDGEMRWIGIAWRDYREWLAKTGGLERFRTAFNREWAIEAGNVERVYDLDRGVTETLIEQGILASRIPRHGNRLSPERIALIIGDALEVVEGLFAFVESERKLSKSYIHELHQVLMRHQDTHEVVDSLGNLVERSLEKGAYKKYPNNPRRPGGEIHHYCPPSQVEAEMDQLLDIANQQAKRNWPAEIRAAWLHHRFTQIHPYSDGNGRIARALASMVLVKDQYFPMLIDKPEWSATYVPALEEADRGDLSPMIRLLVKKQRDALIAASQMIELPDSAVGVEAHTLDDAVRAVHQALSKPLQPEAWFEARATASQLIPVANSRLARLGVTLASTGKVQCKAVDSNYELQLQTLQGVWRIVVTIEFAGHFRGLLLGRLLMHRNGGIWRPAAPEFLITFTEPLESALARFELWLDECLRQAILEWSKSL